MTSKFMTERITLTGCGILKCRGLALRDSFVRTSEILCFGQFPTVSDSFGGLENAVTAETPWDTGNIFIFDDSKTAMDIVVSST